MKKMCCIFALLLTVGLFSGCGPKKDCDLCGREQSATHQAEGMWLCDSCYEGYKALESLLNMAGNL